VLSRKLRRPVIDASIGEAVYLRMKGKCMECGAKFIA
jgi:hypothetical protein